MLGSMPRTPVGHKQNLQKPTRLYLIPALSLIVFMRREIGIRMLNFFWLLPLAAALYLVQPLSGRALGDHFLRCFAVAIVVLGIAHRVYLETVKQRGRQVWHSYSRGTSWLSFLPLPDTLIHILLEPVLCACLGWYVAGHHSVWLGFWMMGAAAALFLTEFHDYRNSLHRAWDISDGEVEGRAQSAAIMGRQRRAGAGPASVMAGRSPSRGWRPWPSQRRMKARS